jgi:hypothetical protein
MKAVAAGSIKVPGLSRERAAEYVAGQSPKGLPERSGKKVPRTAKTPKVKR